jgi:alkylhydroperoxidase family enzyme
LEGLLDFETGSFTDAEKVALRYARALTLEPQSIDDALFAAVREHYDEGEIVEISAMAGLFNYFNRVNDALQMQPTKPGEGLE